VINLILNWQVFEGFYLLGLSFPFVFFLTCTTLGGILFHFSFFLSLFLRDVLLELRIVFLIFRLLDLFARGFFFNAKTGDKDTEGKY